MARDFDGSTQWMQSTLETDNQVSGAGEIAIGFWMYIDTIDAASDDTIIVIASGTGDSLRLDFNNDHAGATDLMRFVAVTSGTDGEWTAGLPATDVWHYILINYDFGNPTTNPIIYCTDEVDMLRSVTGRITPTGDADNNVTKVQLARTGARWFDGKLAEVAFWNRAVSFEEFKALCGNKQGKVDSAGIRLGGMTPLLFKNELKSYLPLHGNQEPESDPLGGTTTNYVEPGRFPHPGMTYAANQSFLYHIKRNTADLGTGGPMFMTDGFAVG